MVGQELSTLDILTRVIKGKKLVVFFSTAITFQ